MTTNTQTDRAAVILAEKLAYGQKATEGGIAFAAKVIELATEATAKADAEARKAATARRQELNAQAA